MAFKSRATAVVPSAARTLNAKSRSRRARSMFASAIEALESRQHLTAVTVSIAALDAVASEPGAAKLRLTRDSTTGTLTVGLTVTDEGSAVSGTDFVALPATVTFAAGSATADVVLTAKDDTEFEGKEDVVVAIAESKDESYVADEDKASATVTINDNDKPTMSVTALDANGAEVDEDSDAEIATFRISRTGSTDGEQIVNFAVSGTATSDKDFAAIGTGVGIAEGKSYFDIDVVPIDDAIAEDTETVKLTLVANAAYNIATGATSNATVNIADNDPPTLTITAADATATEGSATDTAKFTITRDGPTTGALTVRYEASGTATNKTDYDELAGTVTIPAGKASADVIIKTKQDADYEANETVTLTLAADAKYTFDKAKAAASATIADDDKPTVTLTVGDATAYESGSNTNAYFKISRTGVPTEALKVPITIAGTASKGGDFKTISTIVTIPAGRYSTKLQIKAKDDDAVEGDETVIVTLAPDAKFLIGADKTGTVTLKDDDLPTISVAATDPTATEGAKPDAGVFTISRDVATPFPVTVNFEIGGTAKNETDYAKVAASAVIPAGKLFTTVVVTPKDDADYEGTETVTLTLAEDDAYDIDGDDADATVKLADNETPTVSIDLSGNMIEDGSAGKVVVGRAGATTDPVTVAINWAGTAINGVDYEALPKTVTINAGESQSVVTIKPLQDKLVEGDETLIGAIVAGPTYKIDPDNKADTATLKDDDLPTISVAANVANASEPAGKGQFTVTRDGILTQPLTVTYKVTGTAEADADYAKLAGTVVIPAGKASATIDVAPKDDTDVEAKETVIVTVEAAEGKYLAAADGANKATVTIADNEKPTVSLEATDATMVEKWDEDKDDADDKTATFTVTRTGPTTEALDVFYTVAGTATTGTDTTEALTGKVTIAVGSSTAKIELARKDDAVYEGAETVVLTLKDATVAKGAALPYLIDAKKTGSVTIADDDKPKVSLVGVTSTASEKGGKLVFNVVRDGITSAALTVPLAFDGDAAAADLAAALPESVVIPAGKTFSTVTIVAKDDTTYEGGESLTVEIAESEAGAYVIDGTSPLEMSLTDDEQPTITIEATDATADEAGASTGTFTVSRGVKAAEAVTVNLGLGGNAKNGKDYTAIARTVTIPAGADSVKVTVKPKADKAVEGPEQVVVELKAGTGYKLGTTKLKDTVAIADAQKPTITIEAADESVAEDDANGSWFRISRDGRTAGTAVAVKFAAGGTADAGTYTLSDEDGKAIVDGVVTIPQGEAYVDVFVTPKDDDKETGDRTVKLTITESDNYDGTPDAAITIKDDDKA